MREKSFFNINISYFLTLIFSTLRPRINYFIQKCSNQNEVQGYWILPRKKLWNIFLINFPSELKVVSVEQKPVKKEERFLNWGWGRAQKGVAKTLFSDKKHFLSKILSPLLKYSRRTAFQPLLMCSLLIFFLFFLSVFFLSVFLFALIFSFSCQFSYFLFFCFLIFSYFPVCFLIFSFSVFLFSFFLSVFLISLFLFSFFYVIFICFLTLSFCLFYCFLFFWLRIHSLLSVDGCFSVSFLYFLSHSFFLLHLNILFCTSIFLSFYS